MERKHWEKRYGFFPPFSCPRCSKGELRNTTDKFKREPKHITDSLREDDIQSELAEGRFIALLKCSNRSCGEIVAIAGDYESHGSYDIGPEGGLDHFWNDTFKPTSMHPAPPIITWPKKLDGAIKTHLRVSFELFWVDSAACANRLRIVVELLLDQLEIPRKGPKGNRKNARFDLSDRIDLLRIARPGHEKALTALRIVGNTGSHEGDVEFEELLDCFELLEDALVELLEERRAKLEAKADAIIKRRNPPVAG